MQIKASGSTRIGTVQATCVPYHARRARLAICRDAPTETKDERGSINSIPPGSFSRKQRRSADDTKLEDRPIALYRPMDPQGSVSLTKRPYRHGELRRQLGNISQRMLTRTLRSLETAGLVARRVMGSRPVAVEYSLTRLGRTLVSPLGSMCRWARRNRRNVTADVHLSGISDVSQSGSQT